MKNKKNSTVIGQFSGKCCDGSVENNNQMTLPVELFQNLIASAEYKEAIKNRYYIGFLGHPEDPGCQDFKDACIVMTDMNLEDNGEVTGTFDLIDTPVGRVVKAFIDAGVTFGISIRGAGDVDGNGVVDPDTFVFRGFDLVTFPAYNDAVPTFREIAASSDLDKQVKYKKVCKTVKDNLQSITSSTTLDTIKDQFNENSDEYEAIQAHIDELEEDEDNELSEEQQIPEENVAITAQQLEGMTQLYLEQVEANRRLNNRLKSLSLELRDTRVSASRKLKSVKRITSSQVTDLRGELQKVEASRQTLVSANSKLKKEAENLQKQNLNYRHKIEANSETICQKDSTISDLKTKLGETVTASKGVQRRASNLDEKVESLKAQVEAAGQIIFEYQKAYANMYANALGVHLKDIPITSTTGVEALKKIILGGTSTSNIPANPAMDDVVIIDDAEYDDDEIVTI